MIGISKEATSLHPSFVTVHGYKLKNAARDDMGTIGSDIVTTPTTHPNAKSELLFSYNHIHSEKKLYPPPFLSGTSVPAILRISVIMIIAVLFILSSIPMGSV